VSSVVFGRFSSLALTPAPTVSCVCGGANAARQTPTCLLFAGLIRRDSGPQNVSAIRDPIRQRLAESRIRNTSLAGGSKSAPT